MKQNAFNIPDRFYRVSIKALILDDEKRFLLVLENNELWELPGGGLDFTPSDECTKLKFFTKEEAMKEKLFSNVEEFVKIYNSDNHEVKIKNR